MNKNLVLKGSFFTINYRRLARGEEGHRREQFRRKDEDYPRGNWDSLRGQIIWVRDVRNKSVK